MSNEESASSQFTYSNVPYFPTPFHLQQSVVNPMASQQYLESYDYMHHVQLPPNIPHARVPVAPGTYSLPQFLPQAHQLFQRDAQAITPEALKNVKAALAKHKADTKKKAVPRKAAGQTWEDSTLAEWPENDYRLFCGNLGNEATDKILTNAFSRFPNFNMAKVVRDKRTGKTKGYGFVSFSSPDDLAAAVKEMNGKFVGNRPIKLNKSTWRERTDLEALERQKYQTRKKPKQSKKSILHK
ncbi:hypothetical protein IFM89_010330 [Coptis chinensis]|uniref:RRM domain-containing protein n=1 Tax=Coptis chinensis TaxID=261450 RepID=A0A835HU97_9MAGN|nr:hypothetical protein IFM89_010330 [Coptis chinensis]